MPQTPIDPRVVEIFTAAFQSPEHDAFELPGGRGSAILVHGFPGSPADLWPMGRALNQADWRVRGLLLPGFGKDIPTLVDRCYQDWLDCVVQALRQERDAGGALILVGHSMGGALALRAAVDVPPDKLVLLAPFWKVPNALWKAVPVIQRVIPTIQPFRLVQMDFDSVDARNGLNRFLPDASFDDPETQRTLRDFRVPTRLFGELRRAGLEGARAAPAIACPALVVQGDADALVRPGLTRALVRSMPAGTRYVEVQGAHDVNEDSLASWPAVWGAVSEFVDGAQAAES